MSESYDEIERRLRDAVTDAELAWHTAITEAPLTDRAATSCRDLADALDALLTFVRARVKVDEAVAIRKLELQVGTTGTVLSHLQHEQDRLTAELDRLAAEVRDGA